MSSLLSRNAANHSYTICKYSTLHIQLNDVDLCFLAAIYKFNVN